MTEKRKATINTPNLRFSGFEEEWEESKIGKVAIIKSGSTPLRSNHLFFEDGNIPWVKTTDLNNSFIYDTEEKITEYAKARINPVNSVLVAMYGGFNQIGRTGYLKIPAATNQALSVLNANQNQINPVYLLIWLNAKVDLWRGFAGSSRKDPNITGNDVAAFPVSFPSLGEQQKIANFLSLVDDRIQTQSKIISQLESLIQGLREKIFKQQIRFKDDGNNFPDWEIKRLGEIAKKQASNISANSLDDNEGEYKIYGAIGVLKSINFYIEEQEYIAIIKDGAGVGRLFLCEERTSVLGTLDMIKSNELCNLKFLYYRMSIIDFSKYTTGSTIPHIYFKDYANEIIKLPCLIEQILIANFFSSIDEKIKAEKKILEQYDTQKKYLLQNMFI